MPFRSSGRPYFEIGQWSKAPLLAGLAAVAYFGSARLGYALSIPGGVVTLWPPSGVTLGLLLLSGKRDWPYLIAGSFLGSLISDLRTGYSIALAVAAATANITESVVAAWLLTGVSGVPVTLTNLRTAVALTVGASVVSNAVTALLGAAMLHYGFHTPFGTAWFVWWVGDGLGMLIVTPVLLTWGEAAHHWKALRPARIAEAVALGALLTSAAQIALGPPHGWAIEPGPYVCFPFLFWAALRFGPVGAATATVILAAVATSMAALGLGPFVTAGTSPANTAMGVYAYLGLASFSSLIPAVVLQERQTAGDEVGQINARYRTVVDAATDAIVTIDHDSRILFANPATERIFGYAPQELAGRDLTMLMPPELRGRHKSAVRRYLTTGQKNIPWQGVALTGLHKSGRAIPLEISFGEMSEGGRRLFTGILRDISEKRAAEEALDAMEEQYRQSQKMEAIGQLAGGIAHDFNNLLTVITGHCELLAEAWDSTSPQHADLIEIRRAGERATSLTQQLLAFSRRQILAPRVLNLADSVHALEPMLTRLIGEQVQVSVRTAADLGRVRADPGQIEQVILNLAINARDAMPDGGTLRIELKNVALDESSTQQRVDAVPGSYVRLAVSDTGVGMDAATLEHAFEPFFTTKAKGRGTGLGLSTVHGIVKQSGGLVWAYSEPGRGSTFEIYLPLVDAPVDARSAEDAGVARGGSETILVVEDEAGVRRLAERILSGHGYRVLAASTPRDAIDIASRHMPRIHLLLSDVVLPEMSGKALAQQLISEHSALRVLYMSGYADDAIVHHGVLEPDTPFIQKPFAPAALLRKVRELLDE